MVKHIVMFKLKDEAPVAEKLAAMQNFKQAIEATRYPEDRSGVEHQSRRTMAHCPLQRVRLVGRREVLRPTPRPCSGGQAPCRREGKPCLRGL